MHHDSQGLCPDVHQVFLAIGAVPGEGKGRIRNRVVVDLWGAFAIPCAMLSKGGETRWPIWSLRSGAKVIPGLCGPGWV